MKKQHIKVLDEIQARANAKFGDTLWKMQEKADVMLEVVERALTDEKDMFTEAELDKMQTIKDSRILEGMEKVIDEKVAKKMDTFIGKEIDKAIKDGKLPPRDKNPLIKKLKQKHAKSNKKG